VSQVTWIVTFQRYPRLYRAERCPIGLGCAHEGYIGSMAERPLSPDPPTPESSHLTPRELEAAIPLANGVPTNRKQENRRPNWVALRILVWSPALLSLLMFFVTPTYFRPMLENFIGLVLLGITFGALWVGFGLVEAAIWLYRKRRVALAVLVLVGYFITWLVAVSIVLLGPAALILMKPRS
jgi:hypothetical protein